MSNVNKSIPQLEQYKDLVELHKGQHSTVWSCRDVSKGSIVVIKSYDKEKMRPRHVRSVIREKRLLQALNESR
jgi:serine/threonine protein kinase